MQPTRILFIAFMLLLGVGIWFFRQAPNKVPTQPPVSKTAQSSTAKNVITICALRDHSFEVALKLLKESDFEERTGIEVKAILLEFEPMVRAHELSFEDGGHDYDLVSIDQPMLGRYVTRQWVRPLDEFMDDPNLPGLDLEDVVPVLRGACGQWQKKLYAVPLGSYGALLAYRKDVLDAYGLTPPKTFEEFLSHARKVNAPPKLYGTALFAHLGEYITADAAPFLWSWGAGLINGSDFNRPDLPQFRVGWDTPEGLAALSFYANFYKEKLAPPETLSFDHERYIEAFQQGRIAMGIMPAEGIGAPMEDPRHSKVIGKISYAPLPRRKQADGTLEPARAALGAHSLAVSTGSRHPNDAYRVLQFLTGANIGAAYIKQGGRPFRQSHFTPEALAQWPYLDAIQETMKTGRCRPNIPEYPAVSEIFFTAFHAALQHNANVKEVMTAAAHKANQEVLAPAYPAAASRGSQR